MVIKSKIYYIYILTNKYNNVFYVGFTDNLIKRVWQHKNKLVDGFTKKYNVDKLVYFEEYLTPLEGITREKQLKNWHKDWKINLVKSKNPQFRDLYPSLIGEKTDPETP